MRTSLLTLGLVLAAAVTLLEPVLCSTAARVGDPVAELRRWSKQGPQREAKELAEVERVLRQLDRDWDEHEKRRVRIQTVWLDFLGRCQRIAEEVAVDPSFGSLNAENGYRGEAELRRRVTDALSRRLPELRAWLTQDVLGPDSRHSVERRTAACEVLGGDESEEAVSALLRSTRSASREVLDAAIGALTGRERSEVHLRFIELLEQADVGEVELWRWPIEQHFLSLELAADDAAAIQRVATYVALASRHEDWRSASRAVSVGHCLPNPAVFPGMIRSLKVWIERGADEDRRVRRVQGELLAALRARSGRSLGLHPDRWTALWERNRRGEVNFAGEGSGGERITQAGFFGLRPATDRVVFVLDRSGSMDTSFGGNSSHSRLEEAASQMANFLVQLGPRTQFGVVVFSDKTQVWHDKLRAASEARIAKAQAWVLRGGDRAGTQLRAGVLKALHVDKRGKQDLEALEADTIIVLCDGSTAEGPGWVVPLMRRIGDDSRVIFHAVQLGSTGDGTLQALCSATGGNFVQVDG